MSNCKNVCKLCPNLIISAGVSFTGGNLVINLPAGSYENGRKFCIVVAQSIPNTVTVNAPVYITIGTGAVLYPLTNRCCAQITACSIRTRTKYSVALSTTPTGGIFKALGNLPCAPNNNLRAVNGTAPVAEPVTPEVGA